MTQAKKFSDLWDFQSADRQRKIQVSQHFDKAATAASALLFATKGRKRLSKLGLALAAATSAGVYAFNRSNTQKSVEAVRKIITDYSEPAPQNIQDMAQRLFDKAGITKKPDIRVAKLPEKPQFTGTGLVDDIIKMSPDERDEYRKKQCDHLEKLTKYSEEKKNWSPQLYALSGVIELSAFTVLENVTQDKNKGTILIGQKYLDSLTKEEIAAILAHEVSHVKIDQPGSTTAEAQFNSASSSLVGGFSSGSLLTGVWSLYFINSALNLGRNFVNKKAKRLDEERADRNSIGLFPHPTALRTGLEKTLKLQANALGQDMESRAYKIKHTIGGVHNSLEQRQKDMEQFYAEAKNFYAEHGFDMGKECTAILGSAKPTGTRARKPRKGQKPS